MKPIETIYRGVPFRSRLEARWAVFFDVMEWGWQYEVHSVTTPTGPYTPDFFLNKQNVFAEIKPVEPTGFEIVRMKEAQPILLLIGAPSFRDYWLLANNDEKLMLLDTEWRKAPMDRAVSQYDFSMPYHWAVDKAIHARFDGYDADRALIKQRYE